MVKLEVVAKKSLLRVCAWCSPQRTILADGNPGEILTTDQKRSFALTHGICNPCAEKMERESSDLEILRAADAAGII